MLFQGDKNYNEPQMSGQPFSSSSQNQGDYRGFSTNNYLSKFISTCTDRKTIYVVMIKKTIYTYYHKRVFRRIINIDNFVIDRLATTLELFSIYRLEAFYITRSLYFSNFLINNTLIPKEMDS